MTMLCDKRAAAALRGKTPSGRRISDLTPPESDKEFPAPRFSGFAAPTGNSCATPQRIHPSQTTNIVSTRANRAPYSGPASSPAPMNHISF